MSRKEAREKLFKLIYEYLFWGIKNDITLNEFLLGSDPDENTRYLCDMYDGVIANFDYIKDIIMTYCHDFAFERIYKTDLALLMISVYEIAFRPDIPFQVSVNEALEIAKVYSAEKSGAFINGILASVIADKDKYIRSAI